MGFRDYNSGLNRFTTRDMYNGALSDMNLSTDPWTMNRYAFGGGNPVSMVELDGHLADPGGAGGGVDTADEQTRLAREFYYTDDLGTKIVDFAKFFVADWGEKGEDYYNFNTQLYMANGADEQTAEVISTVWTGYAIGKVSAPYVPKAAKTAEAAEAQKIWTGKDKYVPELANAIEEQFPNKITAVERQIFDSTGQLITDLDIELENLVIQVKSGGAKGLTGQMIRTADATRKTVISFTPNIKKTAAVLTGVRNAGV